MKKIIIVVCLATSIICCNPRSKPKDGIEIEKTAIESKDVDDILPDSLFYKLNMVFFDMQSIPYDESTNSYKLEVSVGSFRQVLISGIKELGAGTRTNIWYLSKQGSNKNGYLITVYIQDDLDSRAIYLVSLDKNLALVDYRKIGYEKYDLEDQTDTCSISFCDIIATYKTNENDYAVVTQEKKTFNYNSGKRVKIESDSTLLTIKNRKFLYKKL